MSPTNIRFQKQRELGDIISDTFKFIRQNFKPLGKFIFNITGPVFVILLVAIGFYSYVGMESFGNSVFNIASELDPTVYLVSLFIMLSALLAFYVLLYATVLHYIRSYVEHDGAVVDTDVYQGVKRDFTGMLGLLILSTIITAAGTLLCILPGIFLWVPLSLAPALLVFRGNSAIDAISDSFELVKDNWWISFFTLFVMGLLVYIIGMVFQFPLMIYYFFKAFITAREASTVDPSSLFDWVYVVANVISSLIQYLLYTVVVISSALIFYNLDEKKNFTGSMRTISNLGESDRE